MIVSSCSPFSRVTTNPAIGHHWRCQSCHYSCQRQLPLVTSFNSQTSLLSQSLSHTWPSNPLVCHWWREGNDENKEEGFLWGRGVHEWFLRDRDLLLPWGAMVQDKKKRKWVRIIVVLLPWGFKGGLGGFGDTVAVVWSWWRSWLGTGGGGLGDSRT